MEQQFFHYFDRAFVFLVERLILWTLIRLSESLRLHQLQRPALSSWTDRVPNKLRVQYVFVHAYLFRRRSINL